MQSQSIVFLSFVHARALCGLSVALWPSMVASRKAACGSQGDKQSDIVARFASEIGGSSASSSVATPKVVSSAGFVPSTAATQAEKEKQRDWDRSSLLKVGDDDTLVQIYQSYAQNAKIPTPRASAPAAGLVRAPSLRLPGPAVVAA